MNEIYRRSIYGNTELLNNLTFIYSDESLLKYFLKVGGELAKVQGELDVIPIESAREIHRVANTDFLDKSSYLHKTSIVGFPIVAIVEQLSAATGKHGNYVHWGATTQDIMDTALMLQINDALLCIKAELKEIIESLLTLIKTHKNSIMVGRSQMQHGLPITFSFKAALWISPLLRHMVEINDLLKNSLFIQFGGAVGTLASLDDGLKIRKELAKKLSLAEPSISWHSSREVLVEIMNRVTLLSGSIGKIGKDIILMSQTEISEVSEKKIEGRGISSTMPQKRNPISAQALLISAKSTSSLMNSMYDSLLNDHERGTGVWQLEWIAIPNLLLHAAGGIGVANNLLKGLDVYPENMKINLMKTNGFVMAESVMMQLAKKMGRQEAHDLVHSLIVKAERENKSFNEILECEKLLAVYSKEEISSWLNPHNYLGQSEHMIEEIIKKTEQIIITD